MPSPLRLTGTIASRGFAEGPLMPLGGAPYRVRTSGSPDIEVRALKDAIARSVAELGRLTTSAGGAGAAMLEFQIAMLEDEALTEMTFASIAAGTSAEAAWTATLNEQVANYETAEDKYFRARSADLRDIRDRVLRALAGAEETRPSAGAILAGDDITPSQFLAADWSKGGGIVLRQGSTASHVAMLARARGVPMLVGLSGLPIAGAQAALVDAEMGTILLDPTEDSRAEFRMRQRAAADRRQRATAAAHLGATTADGAPISVLLNIAEPDDVISTDVETCDGVGLMRTEFLYTRGLPDEETQYAAYCKVLEWAGDKPVTIRTVDAGGDKPVPGLTLEEANPFLGVRGIRLCLEHQDVFRVQLRALLRAAVHGNLKVMFPMVTVASEYEAAKALVLEEAQNLDAQGIPFAMPHLGIMVEVPAVAIAPELFAAVAFFSIGSNDLTQYVMAAARDNGAVAALNDACHPAVLSLLSNVVRFGAECDIPVSLCGDAGGDPAALPALLNAGLRSVSVAPAQLPLAKLAISGVHLGAES
jgi:phosphoenolpyruvate-protein phosphotransferase (PTS system enzyme I)